MDTTSKLTAKLNRGFEANSIRFEYFLENAPCEYSRKISVFEFDDENPKPKYEQIFDEATCKQTVNSRKIFEFIMQAETTSCKIELTIETQPLELEDAIVSKLKLSWNGIIGIAPQNYKYISRNVLRKLHSNAMQFCKDNRCDCLEPVDCFSRCKSDTEWKAITKNGQLCMETYIRRNGHPSRLNYSRGGIFFFTRPVPLKFSYFGDKEMRFTKDNLFVKNPAENYALYFADFRCFGTSSRERDDSKIAHYITIAVCRSGTEEHGYCEKHLIPLKMKQNPFFQLQETEDGWDFFVPNNPLQYRNPVWIEIFFMDNVSVKDVESREITHDSPWWRTSSSSSCIYCGLDTFDISPELMDDEESA